MKKNEIKDTSWFISKAKTVHCDKYDYSESQYLGCRQPVKIICKKHGSFMQLACHHIQGKGCKQCVFDRFSKERVLTVSAFIEKAQHLHGNKYDYSGINQFRNGTQKVKITCKEHGAFYQSVNAHLCGKGCTKCKNEKLAIDRVMDIDQFKILASNKHNSKYLYDHAVQFRNSKQKIEITCKKHGSFMQSPNSHLRGAGCPKCKKIILKCGCICDSITEAFYLMYLQSKKIHFLHGQRYPSCLRRIRYDFYLPNEDKYIEVTGFDNRYRSINPEIHAKYLKNMQWKKDFVEGVLGAKFEFLELKLTTKQILSVLKNAI